MASNAYRSLTNTTTTRKNFMILQLTALLGIIGLTYIGAAIAYLIPPKGAGSRKQDVGKISPTGVGDVPFQNGVAGPIIYDASGHGDAQGVYVVWDNQKNTVSSVLDQTCTHLGCPVAWTADSDTFNCPCHGSVYNKDGTNKSGPAPHPLWKHTYSVTNGHLNVEGRQA